jgi:hypothetical protein
MRRVDKKYDHKKHDPKNTMGGLPSLATRFSPDLHTILENTEAGDNAVYSAGVTPSRAFALSVRIQSVRSQ